MNTERIRELAVQAGDDWDHTLESDKEFLKKFAELIVRECSQMVEDKFDCCGDEIIIAEQILKHFGVEEQVQDSKKLHTCPYREEIHNDYESLCDCDEDQQHQCAMDI